MQKTVEMFFLGRRFGYGPPRGETGRCSFPIAGRVVPAILLPAALLFALTGCATLAEDWKTGVEPVKTESSPVSDQARAYESFMIAQMELKRGNRARAVESLRKAQELDPESDTLRAELVSLLVQAGRMDEALKAAREAVARSEKDIRARLLLAGILATKGDTGEAEKVYRGILEIDPHHGESLLFLSTILIQEKRREEAAELLAQHVAHEPDSVMGHYYYGKVLLDLGRFKEAEEELKRVIGLRPHFEAAQFELARLYRRLSQTGKAEMIYQELIEQNPYSDSARDELARLYLGRGDEEKAVEVLNGAPGAKGRGPVKLGLLYLKDKKLEQSISVFEGIIAAEPDNQTALFYLGSVHDEAQHPDLAIKYLKLVGPGSEHYESARLRLAFVLEEEGKKSEAAQAVLEALSHLPDRPDLHLALATLREGMDKLELALATVDEGLKHEPEHTELLFRKGIILDKLKRRGEALEVMQSVLKQEEDHPYALNYVGYTWADQGIKLEEALVMIQKALSQRPKSGYITDSLGWVYFRMGRLEEALEVLHRAVELVPDDPIIMEHLADIYSAMNKMEEARTHYRRALDLKPEDPEKIRQKLKSIDPRKAPAE